MYSGAPQPPMGKTTHLHHRRWLKLGKACPLKRVKSRSEQDDDGDARGIPRSPKEFENITNSAEMFYLNLLSLGNQSPKLSSAEDQRVVIPGGEVHGGETDFPRMIILTMAELAG